MIYFAAPATMLIINIIINWEPLRKNGFHINKQDKDKMVGVRYNYFILSACIYFAVDMTWGILYDYKENPVLFPIIYSLTVFYFLFMLLTMVALAQYIVAFIDKSGRRSALLIFGAWTMLLLGIICLILNRFYHFMFSYNDAHEYVGESGSNISFQLQILFYTVISIYMLIVANKSKGNQKVRYKTVAVTSLVLEVFLVLQILYAFFPFYATGLMIGICLIHSFVLSSVNKEKEIHDHIALIMAEDYDAIFYIEIESGEYLTFSKSQKYKTLNTTTDGKDFFGETLKSLERCVYPDDLEYAKSFYEKETMLKNLEGKRSFSFKYRLVISGEPRYFLFTAMLEKNKQYLIFYEKDIQDELKAEIEQKENQKKTITFGQIAESLASNYDVIYYVDIVNSSYASYVANNIYGELEISRSGEDFFKESYENIPLVVCRQDCEQVRDFIDKDNMISALEIHKDYRLDYRVMRGNRPKYTRMIARKTSDNRHFIIGVEDIDDEVKREKQQLKELKTERELARRDELTGVKNKTAYRELEQSAQGNIENGMDYLNFALVVCDTNNLKLINDTQGHAAGDEYIKASARLLCDIFVHSPVFRVGGDEFVVFLQGSDYSSRHELMDKLRSQVLDNKKMGAGVILASGMSEYKPESDSFVSDIFERADKEMYENKQSLKS
ncbi:GGDEF domain-containing protein [Butyrivibrio sp. DSM 10294]|nr:GGDEF domain-containing protein [Butyrivibrio sp. DSM 10294]